MKEAWAHLPTPPEDKLGEEGVAGDTGPRGFLTVPELGNQPMEKELAFLRTKECNTYNLPFSSGAISFLINAYRKGL